MILPPARLPDRPIRIAAFDFSVEVIPPMTAAAEGKFGDFSAMDSRIRCDPNAGRIKLLDTLLHEILHGIWWAYGIHDNDGEERTVGTLSTALTQIFRDNPDLLRFIHESVATESLPRLDAPPDRPVDSLK